MTALTVFGNIHLPKLNASVCLKNIDKNLLSKKILNGVAPTSGFSKIKPKVLKFKKVKRLTSWSARITFALCLLFFLSGYYPALRFPPIKSSNVFAADEPFQSQEISASSFPQPVKLPHPGYISTRFSAWHPGIDIATPLGTPIHPISAGVVSEVGYDIFGLGNYVVVDHENGFKSKYGHMAKPFVKEGDKVTSDSIIGEVGLTGRTSGPHTHLEITYYGKYVNPELLLPPLSDMPKPEYLTQQSPLQK